MKIEQPACEQCKSRKNSLFHFCHLQEIRDIDQAKTFTLYKKGQFIFHEGANPVGLYCINSGRVKIFRHAPDGKEQITRLARAGDFVGYCSLLSNHPYPVSAAALEEAMVCLVPKTKIIELIRNNFSFSDGLLKLLSRTVEYSFEKMTDLAYKPVRGRLAEALLFLHNFYRDEQNPSGLIALTREDLAAFTGTVKETAIRMLNEFKQENLIEIHRNGISVKNMSGLIRISNLYD